MPWVERGDADGDGAEELGVGWNSFVGEAGAAGSQGAAGLSCPAGMVLDGGLCKTAKVERTAADLVCPQADDGYVVVTTLGELGPSHSCQKTVPAHCTGGKTLHEGQCRTATVEQRDAKWRCSQGTLETTFLDPGYSYWCRITVDPPQCTVDGESYRTTPAAGCYEQVEFHETQGYTWMCSTGVLQVDSGDHGTAYSCKITLASPTCPEGETYRNGRCETQETFYRTRGYTWTCSVGTKVTTSGEHGTSYSCRITLNPPTCPNGETYRNGRCYEQESYYRTRGYTWTCSVGTRVTTSGEHGISYSCRIALSPPTCPAGETYRSSGCYEQESYYDSRPLRYSCPAGYTLKTSGLSRTCTKTETYRKRRCSYDPFAGQQCWWETRTRTLTAAVVESCPAGYSPDGTGCTADSPTTRWKPTGSTPTRYRYTPAARSCPSGWSPSGSVCQSDSPSTRWKRTASTPTRYRYTPAAKSCPSGWSDNGALCESDTASTRWKATASTPTRHRYVPAAKSCPAGWSDNGIQCRSDTAKQRWDRTASVPVTSRTADAVRFCDTGFAWNDSSGKCEKTLYSDPTAPLTKLVGRPPTQSCPAGWDPAGGGQCSRTTLGDPTQTPTGAACIDRLGTLKAGTVTRTGTLGTGCVSLRKGDKQSPHWARRFSLSVAAASKATVAASSSAADTFLYVLSGSGSDVTEEGSDDDSGTGTDAKITGIALAPDTVYTVEVTTPTQNITGAFTLTLTITPDLPAVQITGLADSHGIGQAHAAPSGGFTVQPADASCTASPPDAKITAGNGANRTVSLTRKPPFSQEVTVKCTATGRSEGTAKATLRGHQAIAGLSIAASACKATSDGTADYACTVPADGTATLTGTTQGPHSGLSLSWAATGGAKIDSQTQAKTQTAAPSATPVVYSRTGTADISCTADGSVTLTATAGTHTRAVTVAVTCDKPPPDVDCDDPLGTLPEGTTSRSGTITADSKCTTAHRGRAGTYYTRRHTFTLSGPAQVTVDVGNDPANTAKLDTYLILLDGHSTAGKANARNDDGGPSTDSRIAKKLPPGDYTVEASTYRSGAAGRYQLTAKAVHDRKVAIAGLADTTETGLGQVTVTAPFTVTPAAADCTAGPAAATVAAGIGAADRTLTADVTAPGSLTATVTCTAAGHGAAKRIVTLTAELATGVIVIGARAADGGECKTVTPVPDGAGAAYICTMARGGDFEIEAEATATAAALTVSWAATGGVTVDSQSQGTVTTTVGPDSTVLHRRIATAALNCTTNGTAAATATLGDSTKTAHLTVNCLTPVAVTGLADASETGVGRVAVTAPFTVEPATARCTASPAAATVAAGTSAADRTLTADIAAPGSLAVTVTCETDGYADATQAVTLTAKLAASVTTVGARAITGGDCKTADTVPDGADVAYTCTMARGEDFEIEAEATATAATLTAAWAATGGAAVKTQTQGTATTTVGPDGTVLYRRTATAALNCTANGTAAATAALGASTKTAHLTVNCLTPVTISGLVDTAKTGSGQVTVTAPFTVTPANAACTAEPSTASIADSGNGKRTLTAKLDAPGSIAVTVTCRRDGWAATSQTAALTAALPCGDHLGRLRSGRVSRSGTITADAACTTTHRGSGTFYARRHTFTIGSPGWVTVNLKNANGQYSTRLDTYLILLKGTGATATVIDEDDDDGHRNDSRLTDIFLQPGTYTIEATTYRPAHTGKYTLNLNATVTGLKTDYNAIVGRELKIDFETGKFTPRVSVPASSLSATATRTGTMATLSVTPARTGDFSVTLSFSRPAETSRSGSSEARAQRAESSDSEDTADVGIGVNCPNGQVPGPHPNGTCLWDTDEKLAAIKIGKNERGSQLYEVTPALLDGAKRVAAQALVGHPGCGMGDGQLAAAMIAIGYWEYPIEVNDSNQRVPARSLMTLSRSHRDRHQALYPDNEFKEVVDVGAFWHPGVGYWQLDWWPSEMGHAERADIDKGGLAVATNLAKEYCSPRSGESEEESLGKFLDGTTNRGGWNACKGATKGEPLCYETYQKIYLGVESFSGAERLWVTTTENTGDDHRSGGGVHRMSCGFGATGTDFPCWLYDTDSTLIEGAFNGNNKRGVTGGDSPLAAPFMSFAYGPETNKKNFAVFPQSFAYPAGATGDRVTWIKVVPTDTRVRNTAASSWHEDDFDEDGNDDNDDKELYVNVCQLHITGIPDRCERLSSTSPLFATKVRAAYPGQPPGTDR